MEVTKFHGVVFVSGKKWKEMKFWSHLWAERFKLRTWNSEDAPRFLKKSNIVFARDKIMTVIYSARPFSVFRRRCIFTRPEVSPEAFRRCKKAVYLHCRKSPHAFLTLDLVYHQTKTLRVLPRPRVSSDAFLCVHSRMLVTLALGDSRLVYAVICPTMDDLNSSGALTDRRESLNPFGKERPPNVSPSVAQDKGRKRTRRAFPGPLLLLSLPACRSAPGTNVVAIQNRQLRESISDCPCGIQGLSNLSRRARDAHHYPSTPSKGLAPPIESIFHIILSDRPRATNWTQIFSRRTLSLTRLSNIVSCYVSLCRFPIRCWRRKGGARKFPCIRRIRFPTTCHSRRLTQKINFRPSPHGWTRFCWIQFYATRHRGWTRPREW